MAVEERGASSVMAMDKSDAKPVMDADS